MAQTGGVETGDEVGRRVEDAVEIGGGADRLVGGAVGGEIVGDDEVAAIAELAFSDEMCSRTLRPSGSVPSSVQFSRSGSFRHTRICGCSKTLIASPSPRCRRMSAYPASAR
jgi:hypothetical protein